jgi:hypothetical protein
MRRFVTSGMVASMVLVVSLARGQAPPATPATGPAPHIKFDSTVLNLGDVLRGQDAVAEFVYTNTGDAPLKILAAKPG